MLITVLTGTNGGVAGGTANKRKGPQLESLSSSKQSKEGDRFLKPSTYKGHHDALVATPVTPQVSRGRSISLKGKFKRKKSLGGEELGKIHVPGQQHADGVKNEFFDNTSNCKTPLPSKPTFSSLNLRRNQTIADSSFHAGTNTPGTPNSFGLPSAAQDLSGIGSSGECDGLHDNSSLTTSGDASSSSFNIVRVGSRRRQMDKCKNISNSKIAESPSTVRKGEAVAGSHSRNNTAANAKVKLYLF